MSGMWAELRAAIDRLEKLREVVRTLEATVRRLEQEVRDLRG